MSPLSRKLIARIWHGQTTAAIAEEYTRYLYENGVKKIEAIPNNRGTQMFREFDGGRCDFTVISYWDSVESIKQYAGENYEKTNVLPRDPEYLLEVEPKVQHLEVLVNDWTPAK
jgi:heme-degrading monooxygenase HmoA